MTQTATKTPAPGPVAEPLTIDRKEGETPRAFAHRCYYARMEYSARHSHRCWDIQHFDSNGVELLWGKSDSNDIWREVVTLYHTREK